jgi:hypothetical protein
MDAVRRRVLAFAAERNLAPADYAKLLRKRISSANAVDFCDKYKVSLDWLLCGDLKGLLQRMTKETKAEPPEIPEAKRKEILGLYARPSARDRAVALGCMCQLMARSQIHG